MKTIFTGLDGLMSNNNFFLVQWKINRPGKILEKDYSTLWGCLVTACKKTNRPRTYCNECNKWKFKKKIQGGSYQNSILQFEMA